jgi:stage II sporulation protein D
MPSMLIPEEKRWVLADWQASQLIIKPENDGYVWINDRWYRGRTRIIRQGSGVTALNFSRFRGISL